MTGLTKVRLFAVISIVLAFRLTAVVATQTAKPNSGKLLQVAGSVSAQTAPEAQRFAKAGISFDYPNGWKLEESHGEDSLDLKLSRPNSEMMMTVFIHKGRITPEKLPDAKKSFIDPYINANMKQFVAMGATPKQAPDTSEIGGAKADGVNITASLGGVTGAAKIYWALLGQRVIVLTLFGPDSDIKRYAPAWDLVRTTIKIEEPAPAASPSPKPSP